MRALTLAGNDGRSSSAAYARVVVEARHDETKQFRRKIDLEIADERENRVALADLGQRGGCAGRQVWPAAKRRLSDHVSGPGAVDEVGVGQHGRALKHRCGHFRFVRGQPEDQGARRIARGAKRRRQRPAHQSRWVVEQRGHRQRRFGAHWRSQIRIEISAGERARPMRARLFVGGLRPGEKSAHYVWLGDRGRQQHRLVGVHVCLPRRSWRRTLIA